MTTSQIRQIFSGYYYLSAIRLHAERFSHLKNDRSHFTIADFRQFNYKKYEWNIIWDAIRKLLFKTRPDQDIGGIPDSYPALFINRENKKIFRNNIYVYRKYDKRLFPMPDLFLYLEKLHSTAGNLHAR